MSQDKRIYNGDGRDIASTFHDEQGPLSDRSPTTFARQRLYQAIVVLAQAGYDFSDIQTYVMRHTTDATRDLAKYGLPKDDMRKVFEQVG
ncbi:hypothetical protein HOU00_gp156 [Caulobacter phage CcrPW]|uniref:Uncharacterized protein n=1 Tax=Caulobacter phage CcrPW TaxID=2283271 RepID=A0A385EE43_9CAUD|nr:hypothetical protein HOU00_gp156 [Caulobacter phage CcrPW]AXQ68969.1 hypothetical protein CcrPW_gp430c [Caulobacter phage CcrPW]